MKKIIILFLLISFCSEIPENTVVETTTTTTAPNTTIKDKEPSFVDNFYFYAQGCMFRGEVALQGRFKEDSEIRDEKNTVKVFYVDSLKEANFRFVSVTYDPKKSVCGVWYETNIPKDADFRIYVVENKDDAELLLYEVDDYRDAGPLLED